MIKYPKTEFLIQYAWILYISSILICRLAKFNSRISLEMKLLKHWKYENRTKWIRCRWNLAQKTRLNQWSDIKSTQLELRKLERISHKSKLTLLRILIPKIEILPSSSNSYFHSRPRIETYEGDANPHLVWINWNSSESKVKLSVVDQSIKVDEDYK